MEADPWSSLRRHTAARIALGRAGGSLPTAALLEFAADHAEARDAVHASLDEKLLTESLEPLRMPTLLLRSRAADRQFYLQRPDLGRQLDEASADQLRASTAGPIDVALMIGDGLSAIAPQRHAAAVMLALVPILQQKHFSIGPICIISQARVAIQDEVGSLLGARVAAILLGERPGLRAIDSLGAYLVHGPAIGNTDARRNCISNIRVGQLDPTAAAHAAAWLIEQAIVRRLSGVDLKDDRDPNLLTEAGK